METLVLTIHILIAVALVAIILLQRSEGGGLGIGGSSSSSGGGFMTARGTANLMTRATTFLAIGFFATTVVLAILAGYSNCLLYTSPSPRDRTRSRMPSSA